MSAFDGLAETRILARATGRIVIGFGLLYLLPLATSIAAGEWAPAVDFLVGLSASLAAGFILAAIGSRAGRAGWVHGMAASALSWLAVMALAAIPYALSGNAASYLDACFDAMSGFTTTGLVLLADLDHLSLGLNMWRHVLTFVGGQGVVVLALAFLVSDPSGGYTLYVGEGKDERLFPSVLHTAKAIWRISLAYLCAGTTLLFLAGLDAGLEPPAALLHGLWMFMSSWSTGGFAPMSQNALYYHSLPYEILTLVIFLVGSLNFALHGAVLSGRRRELLSNLESRTFVASLAILSSLACLLLLRAGVYGDAASLFRKGFYLLASGHTTTGLMNVYARQFAREWGDPALLLLIFAMLAGGSACSTAGGLKGLRIGLLAKSLVREARRLFSPPSAVVEQGYRYHGERILDDKLLRNALLVMALYLLTFAATGLAGTLAGFPFLDSLFEAASVTGNVGLSIGVTSPAMPAFLKIAYILVMWAGRLEFMAVIAAIGLLGRLARGKA